MTVSLSKNERMSTAQAIAYFDSLEAVHADQMLGAWRGVGIDTDHPMDGLLEAAGWHGKVFDGPDQVHPLVLRGIGGGRYCINPGLLPLNFFIGLPGRDWLAPVLVPVLRPFLTTRKHRARLRMLEFRGKTTAAMCYDAEPINDVFAGIDENTVMGWMDFKGWEKPFFFKLIRE